tara:strand:+ start:270 stop:821 length:552 start_codon:yes stop_codon:yes gene_type:complete
MADNKKSFLLYCDLIHTVNQLPNEKAGELFKHILRYVNDENPVTDDLITNIAFEPIKQNLKRDLKKWEKFIEKQRVNGSLGGRPKTQITQAFSGKPKKAVSVNVSVKDNIEYRLADFKKSLQQFLSEFDKKTLNEFYLYWTEKKPNGKKMRYEMEKTFDIGRRLKRWDSNNFNSKSNEPSMTL